MPTSSMDGYGYSGEALVLAATELGANIKVKSHDWRETDFTDPKLLDLEVQDYDPSDLLVVYFIPYAFHHFRSKFQLGQTMFETTEIPDVWAAFCTIPRGLIVPSKFCKDTFQKKVDKPIEVVPLGVDTAQYYYMDRPKAGVFTFLMTGLLHYRKGAEFAVKAFKEEFSEKEPVRLVLKTRKGFFDIGDEALRDDIEVINWNYSRDEMRELYYAADCFLAPSRGEASGLTPREAMATGLPVIATNWSGLEEIMDSSYTYPLDIEGFEKAPVECSSYAWGITQGQPIGDFCRPSVPHLRSLMREVYENQDTARKKGQAGSELIYDKWTYKQCAKRWLEAIETLYET